MKLKTYVARNLNEALAQVKKDLGPEAVILSTHTRRTLSPGSGWPRTEVEVKAAMDEHAATDAATFSRESYVDRLPPMSLLHHVQEELKEMKGLLARWLNQHGPPVWLAPHGDLVTLYQMLVSKGVTNQVLLQWLAHVQELLAGPGTPHAAFKQEALRLLMNAFEIAQPFPGNNGRLGRWVFLGPAGVGKTTTIAKLAVHFALRNKSVALISLDSGRVGSQDQLALYSKLLGVPFAPVNDREEFLATLNRLHDRDLILIDTPGLNPVAPEGRMNLTALLGETPELECHLLLSSAWSTANLAAAITGFSKFRLNSLIITKVDESRDFSGLFNQLCSHRLPVSYLTTGQRIPEDLEPASRQRIVSLLLTSHPAGDRLAAAWDDYEQAVGA
jgi:flagellar biosynthesis protein FlhF